MEKDKNVLPAQKDLPKGWVFKAVGEISEINPRVNKSVIPDSLPVAFVPMSAVGAGNGAINITEVRPVF
jgi:hypothetical protein